MKKIERIKQRIEADKEISKRLRSEEYYSQNQFISDCERYIKAIKEGRVINSIGSVSSSGMSRTIKFLAPEKTTYGYNFFAMFRTLGFSPVGKYGDYFRISGCGMDMVFHTNYTNIHKLFRLGFINKKQCEHLAQQTPTTI